jgi:hypothetical protein
MSIDVMKQALHTLEGWVNHGDWVWPESALEQAKRNTTESITALRAAIEERKPVAWRKHYENSGYTYYDARWKNIPPDAEPLYL